MQHRQPRPEWRGDRLLQPHPSSPALQPRACGGSCPCSCLSTPGKPTPRPTRDSQTSFFSPWDLKMCLQCLCESQAKNHATTCLLQHPMVRPLRMGPAAGESEAEPHSPTTSSGSGGWGEQTVTPAGSTLVHWFASSNTPKSKGTRRVGQEQVLRSPMEASQSFGRFGD